MNEYLWLFQYKYQSELKLLLIVKPYLDDNRANKLPAKLKRCTLDYKIQYFFVDFKREKMHKLKF